MFARQSIGALNRRTLAIVLDAIGDVLDMTKKEQGRGIQPLQFVSERIENRIKCPVSKRLLTNRKGEPKMCGIPGLTALISRQIGDIHIIKDARIEAL